MPHFIFIQLIDGEIVMNKVLLFTLSFVLLAAQTVKADEHLPKGAQTPPETETQSTQGAQTPPETQDTQAGSEAAEQVKKDSPESSVGDDEQKPNREGERDRLVREIDLKGLGRDDLSQDLTRGGFDKPTVIDSDSELRKLFKDKKDKEAQDRLDKAVNFKEQKLLVFAWSGSGGDKLGYEVDNKEVLFQFKPGMTKDLRQHVELFALDKDAKYRVEKADAIGNKNQERIDKTRRSEKAGS
jgi:hypothetical protein